jgi:L-lysine cyclodeaminase
MHSPNTLLLTHDDIAQLVDRVGADRVMDELIERLNRAFASFDDLMFDVPARAGFHDTSGLVEWMPLHQRGHSVLMKMVGYHPENPTQRNLPTVVSTLSMFDTRTGQLTAVADGALLTAMRTGAASAVATRIFCCQSARSLGLIGCGAQSVTQLHALMRVCEFETVRVFDTAPSVAASFADRVAWFTDASTRIQVASLHELVEQSDVISTATSVDVGHGPVFCSDLTSPHVHINAIGSDLPGKTELPLALLETAVVCPDFPPQAIVEGECQQLSEHQIGPSLMTVAAAPELWEAARNSRTVFDSTGWALEDFVALDLAIEYANKLGIGTRIAIEAPRSNPWDPYATLRSDINNGLTEQLVARQYSSRVGD